MSKLVKARKWAELHFAEGSLPQNRTIRKWIDQGKLIGTYDGNNTWVREDQSLFSSTKVDEAVDLLIRMSA